MSNSGGWDPFQDDWGSADDVDTGKSKSDFTFDWNPDDDFTQPQSRKTSVLEFINRQPTWAKITSLAGAVLIAFFIFIQAGGITRLQMMGIFRESVSPSTACLNSSQVLIDLGSGLINASAMNQALDKADKLRSQRSGDAAVDEAMWSVAEAVYKTHEAVKVFRTGISLNSLMLGDLTDRFDGPEIRDASEAITRATSLLATACTTQAATDTSQPSAQVSPSEEPVPQETTQEIPSTATASVNLFAAPPDLQELIRVTQNATLEVLCLPNPNIDEVFGASGFISDVSSLTQSPSSDVVVITNHHVIEECINRGQIFIVQDENILEASLRGHDEKNDLALLTAVGLTGGLITLSPEFAVGQWVMASGFPADVGQAVTFGQVTGTDPEEGWITSDALVGPGNSGGPLINSSGEAIGVVGAYFRQVSGISASVPIERLCVQLLQCKR